MAGTLRIIGFSIANFKRIEAFEATIDNDGLHTFGGENANGKTGVIDALHTALIGVPHSLTNPVREGADSAAIRVLLGSGSEIEYKVLRKFDAQGKPSLAVVNKDGDVESQGANLLKEIIGAGSADPLAFLNMAPKDQRNTLAKLVGLDITSFDTEIEEAREKQKELESHQRKVSARVEELPWFDDVPETEVSAAELTTQLQAATTHNSKQVELRTQVTIAESALTGAQQAINQNMAEQQRLEAEIAQLTERLNTKKMEVQALAAAVNDKTDHIARVKAELEAFVPMDTTEITSRMGEIEETNKKVRANQSKVTAREEWIKAEEELKAQIERVDSLQNAKKKALAEAKFPVDGLSFDASTIIYNDQPFAQASQAERIRVATAISIGLRGRACPIFIRDASLLDNKSLKMIADMAEHHGVQVIAEIVANQEDDGGFDKKCEFYIVDGKRFTPPGKTAAQPELTEVAS